MAAKTATICAGVQANGTADCVAFYNGLLKKDYTGEAYGNKGTPASAADFNSARKRSVLYWSSHGSKENATNYRVQGSTWFSVGAQMAGWTKDDPIEIAFFASCYAFGRDYYKQGFAGIMKRTNLFVVCGYSGQAPAGTTTDTDIVNSFFSYTNSGKGVVYSWKDANNHVGTFPWGAISYGTTDANMNFKMPGWGSNSGIDRSQSIWFVNQSKATVIKPLSQTTTPKSAIGLPTEVFIRTTDDHPTTFEHRQQHREMRFATTSDDQLLNILVGDGFMPAPTEDYASHAIPLFQPMYVSDITDDVVGPSRLVGGDLILQNTYRGVPIERNFVRLCADSDGIYDSIDTWQHFYVEDERYSDTTSCGFDSDRILSIVGAREDAGIDECSMCYLLVSPGCLHLCYKIYLPDGHGYIVDVADGCLR